MTHSSRQWLILGANGFVGRHVVEALDGRDTTALTRADVDFREVEELDAIVRATGANVIVNCVVSKDLEAIEEDPTDAHVVNGVAVGVLASTAQAAGATLIHISADYVFAGDAVEPYRETDAANPVNSYGRTKLDGDRAVLTSTGSHYVLRTGSLFGSGVRNFASIMSEAAREQREVSALIDGRSAPTSVRDLAASIVHIAEASPPSGLYNCVNAGEASWYDYAREIFAIHGAPLDLVRPATTQAVPGRARRPAYTVLSPSKWNEAGLQPLPGWSSALRRDLAGSGSTGG